MNSEKRIQAFVQLGKVLSSMEKTDTAAYSDSVREKALALNKLLAESRYYNNWFVEENVRYALASIASMLDETELKTWLKKYSLKESDAKRVGVIMAGNIPMVGFHDFLCVLLSGHTFIGKTSSDDKYLLPAMAELIMAMEPAFAGRIRFTENKLEGFDAVIATGSNNSARYFEYYFGKYPHIIRKSRQGIAVLDGSETSEELTLLADDIFMYYGLGCRSVSKIFVPVGYSFDGFLKAMEKYKEVAMHHKYFNNYEYNRAIYLINKEEHIDYGFLMLKESQAMASPISVLFYEYYSDKEMLFNKLELEKDQIQCIVGHADKKRQMIPFGKAQQPLVHEYADGIDTMEFLMNL